VPTRRGAARRRPCTALQDQGQRTEDTGFQPRPRVTLTAPTRLSPMPFCRIASTSLRRRTSRRRPPGPTVGASLRKISSICMRLSRFRYGRLLDMASKESATRGSEPQGDLFTREAVRVTGSVVTLVVVPHSGQMWCSSSGLEDRHADLDVHWILRNSSTSAGRSS